MKDLKFYYDLKKLFYFKDINHLTEGKIDDVRKKLYDIIYYRNKKQKSTNNKISDEMFKEIEIYFYKDIKENEKYNLINQPVIDHKQRKPKRKKVKVNNLKEQHIFNFNNFNVISTLSSSVELVLYSCSHR